MSEDEKDLIELTNEARATLLEAITEQAARSPNADVLQKLAHSYALTVGAHFGVLPSVQIKPRG